MVIYNIADTSFCPECIYICLHNWYTGTLVYREAGRISVPIGTWSVQDSLNTADAHGQDCPQPLINSTTGHYSSTCTHNTSLWLAFLANLQQGRAWNKALNCTNNHFHACLPEIYQKYRRLSIPDREWQSMHMVSLKEVLLNIFHLIYMKHAWYSRLHFKDSCMCQTSTIICYCIFIFSVLDETSGGMYMPWEIERLTYIGTASLIYHAFTGLTVMICNACERWLYNTKFIPAT